MLCVKLPSIENGLAVAERTKNGRKGIAVTYTIQPEAKRKEMWRRLQDIYTDELPVIPLYFRAEPYILPKWLKGLEPTGHQDPSTLWVENWRAE